ncbi:MAG: hypothetical protein ABIG89_04280 [Candidatus Woesearchaeota archaeon]
MKKLLAVIVLIILLAGGLYLIKTNEKEPLLNDYKCNINNVDYYVHNEVIYLVGSDNKEYIYTDFGVYERKETKDGWILDIHKNKFKSIYLTVFDWIKEGKHPTAGKIKCEKFEDFPEGFKVFIDTHGIVFNRIKEDFKEIE